MRVLLPPPPVPPPPQPMRLLRRAEWEITIEKESQSSHQTNATSAADNRRWGELGFSAQLVSQSTWRGGKKTP